MRVTVVMILLPVLYLGLTARQLAGVIAHEFGHFTQGTAMRLTYLVGQVNLWFARVVYQRDAWDLWLDTLDNDLPAYFLAHAVAVPAQVQTAIEDRLGLEKSGIFDTHPSPGDRIRKARQAANPGIFHLDAPATGLFTNFPVASKQVTLLHYSDSLGLPLGMARLFAVEPADTTMIA